MIKFFTELGYAVQLIHENDNAHVDFKIVDCEWAPEGETIEDPKFIEFTSGRDYGSDISKANVFCTGYVKWDGCGHWNFDYLHTCSRENIEAISKIMLKVYDLVKEILSQADYD